MCSSLRSITSLASAFNCVYSHPHQSTKLLHTITISQLSPHQSHMMPLPFKPARSSLHSFPELLFPFPLSHRVANLPGTSAPVLLPCPLSRPVTIFPYPKNARTCT